MIRTDQTCGIQRGAAGLGTHTQRKRADRTGAVWGRYKPPPDQQDKIKTRHETTGVEIGCLQRGDSNIREEEDFGGAGRGAKRKKKMQSRHDSTYDEDGEGPIATRSPQIRHKTHKHTNTLALAVESRETSERDDHRHSY